MSKKSKGLSKPVKPHVKKLSFSATSLTPQTTPLNPTGHIPTVYYATHAWLKMWKIIELCPQEVGWLGTVDVLENGDYLIDEIYLLDQEVTGGTTDIESDAVANLAVELESSGIDSSRLRYWGHSHVNMQVGPSGTDEQQLNDYLDTGTPFFIRGIYNKKFDQKVDVFDVENKLIYQAVQSKEHRPDFGNDWVAALKQEIAAKVKQKVYTYSNKGRSPTGSWYQPSTDFKAIADRHSTKRAQTSWYEDEYGLGYDYSGGYAWPYKKK